jgi:uncharacterized membrane protein HdeD (DUF308 family)
MSFSGSVGGMGAPTPSANLMRDHWRPFLVEGIILLILGFLAMIVPPVAGLAATVLLGWLFLIAGIVGLVSTFRARSAPGFAWSLLSAVVAILAGAVLLWNPLQGLFTLTYVLVAFFIFDGIFMIIFALEHRREMSGRWGWMMFNGVMDLLLAAIVISGFPGSFVWALGLLVGIDMMFGGASLIAMALAARQPINP